MRPKFEIYTPKRDDEHPRPFHMRVPIPPSWAAIICTSIVLLSDTLLLTKNFLLPYPTKEYLGPENQSFHLCMGGGGGGVRSADNQTKKIVSLKIVASASWKENISLSLITRSVYKDYWPTPSQKSRGYSEMCTFSNYSRLFNDLIVFWKTISMTNASHFSQWVKKYRILRRNHVISAGRSSRRRLADSFLPINVA